MSIPNRTYYRVEETDIIPDRDIVVWLYTDGDNRMSRVRTPEWGWSEPMAPQTAFISAFEQVESETFEAELVIMDPEGLWNAAWGKLVERPARMKTSR